LLLKEPHPSDQTVLMHVMCVLLHSVSDGGGGHHDGSSDCRGHSSGEDQRCMFRPLTSSLCPKQFSASAVRFTGRGSQRRGRGSQERRVVQRSTGSRGASGPSPSSSQCMPIATLSHFTGVTCRHRPPCHTFGLSHAGYLGSDARSDGQRWRRRAGGCPISGPRAVSRLGLQSGQNRPTAAAILRRNLEPDPGPIPGER
jgi:hypothetical protein